MPDAPEAAEPKSGQPAEAAPTSPMLARGPHEVEPADVRSAVFMGVFFVGSILLALVIADALADEVPPAFEDPDSVANPLIYLVLVIVFTAVILLIVKFGGKRFIRWFILGAVFLTMVYIYQPVLSHYVPALGDWSVLGAVALALSLTTLLYRYPEWYVVDAAGVSVAAGATGIFGFSFGIVPALILLVAFAVYDFVAVYRTKHMLDLADTVLDLRLPVMLVVPKVRGYSFLAGERIDKNEPKRERDALFMGLGDIVIPGVLVVSSFVFLGERATRNGVDAVLGLAPHVFVALATLVGATIGFFFLMRSVLKGTPHAGLPALCGGALVLFLATTLWLYGVDPLVPKF